MGNTTSSLTCEGEYCMLCPPKSKPMSHDDQKTNEIVENEIIKIKQIQKKEAEKNALFKEKFDEQIKKEIETNPWFAKMIAVTSLERKSMEANEGLSQSLRVFLQSGSVSACTIIADVQVCVVTYTNRYSNLDGTRYLKLK